MTTWGPQHCQVLEVCAKPQRDQAGGQGTEHLAQRSERSVPPNHRAILLGNKCPIIQRAYIQSVLRLRGQDPPHLFYRCPLVLSHMGSEDQTPRCQLLWKAQQSRLCA